MKPRGESGLLNARNIEKMRVKLCTSLSDRHLKNTVNTEEVATFFRSFPSKKICVATQPKAYKRDQDILKAVMLAAADGKTLQLVIIGKLRRPKLILQIFDATHDLTIL